MGRRPLTQRLHVWMNGSPVAAWDKIRNEEHLTYFPDWLNQEEGRPLSLSLPFTPDNQTYRGAIVSSFFDNLLPDNDAIRRRLAQRHHTESTDPFSLLAELGRDCVGAIQLLPQDEEPADLFSISGRPLDEQEIARLLRNTTSTAPLGQADAHDDLRLSIAGVQEKTALLFHDGRWHLPEGSTPTTHIFKLPLGLVGNRRADMQGSVENEWLCSKLMEAYGLPIAHCDIGSFEDQKVLIVERFDRKPSADGSWIIRLPQEDMCQATGTPSLQKYQADGGPNIADVMQVLNGSDKAAQDKRNFLKTQIVFWLLAATDGHAKNFSIAHLSGGSYRATPLYDVLSAHPITGPGPNQIAAQRLKLAMAIRGGSNYYLIDRIQRRHWSAQAAQVGLGGALAEEIIEEVIASTDAVIDAVGKQLPKDFPAKLADAIFDGIAMQSRRLAAMAAAV